MFDTITEITETIKEREGAFEAMWQQMDDDFDLLALTPYKPDKRGEESYTSSAPRTYFDKILDGVNQAKVTIQIKLPEKASKRETAAASQGELFLFGALADIDRRLVSAGEPSLRESLGYLSSARGWMMFRCLVYVPKGEKDVVFDVVPWDPQHVVFERGRNGLIYAAYSRKATRTQIKDEYGIDISEKDAMVTDWWDTEKNAVIINNDKWAKEPEDHKIGHVPVFIGSVGSMPSMTRKDHSPTLTLQGNSVWSATRGLYKPANKFVSWTMQKAKQSVVGSLIHESPNADKEFPAGVNPFDSYQEIKIQTGSEKIYPLQGIPLPPEMGATLTLIEKDIQQGTLPYPLAYGGTEEAMSGRALSVLADNTRSQYSPRTGLMATGYTWLCEELLTQYPAKGEKKAVTLRGYGADESFFTTTVKPTDIDTGWHVEVKVEPELPRDKEAEVALAKAVTRPDGPGGMALMSMQTALEEYMRLRDPHAEQDKVLAQMGMILPPIMTAQIAAALEERGEKELAQQVKALGQGQGQGGAQGGGLPVEAVVEALVQAFAASGNQQMAEGFLSALQGLSQPAESINGAVPV